MSDTTNYYLLPAFAEGEAAAKKYNAEYGDTFNNHPNPYPKGTDEFKAWSLGWNVTVRR